MNARRVLRTRNTTVMAVVGAVVLAGGIATAATLSLTSSKIASGTKAVTVPKFQPSLSASAAPTATTAGAALTDVAALSGGTTGISGNITYQLYGPGNSTCTGAPVASPSVAVNGNGNYTSSPAPTPTAVGTYQWTVSYAGDTRNSPAPTPSASCGNGGSVVLTGAAQTVSATLLGSASDTTTGSSTSTVTGLNPTAGKTLLVLVYRQASASGMTIASISGSAVSGSPSQIATQAFTSNTKFAVFAWKATATATANSSLTVDFGSAKNTKTVIDVVQLSGNNTSSVTAQAVTAQDASAGTTASVSLTSPSASNGEIFFVGTDAATSVSTPTNFTALDAPASTVTGSFVRNQAQGTVSSTLGASVNWGAIALEIAHG